MQTNAVGIHIADDIGNADSGNNSASFDEANMENISGGELGHYIPPESAWVRCDECYKWRRIPFSLLELIDEHCRWYTSFFFLFHYHDFKYAIYVKIAIALFL